MSTGDTIVRIDGQPIVAWDDMTRAIARSNGQPLSVVIERPHKAAINGAGGAENAAGAKKDGRNQPAGRCFGQAAARGKRTDAHRLACAGDRERGALPRGLCAETIDEIKKMG